MSVKLNPAAVRFAKQLIQAGKFKNDAGHWREHNPDTAAENKFLDRHEIEEYAQWHLGEDTTLGEDTKGRYKFPFGDFKTVHRDGLLAAKERAAQQGYHDIERAADELEQLLEKQAAK
ncbi:hypothetical protein EJV47_22915 [Hymenobacter gummosus]|uniref:Uncharacterized protein n=1 Tax=Hymenobacter gummosus TaxID=1776032 RepID=A0A3S0IJZ1_9BACT|nr:hypothetical protein [Hymenobacter gummosus]RTQ46013.1 hypothetical protein EJV47_22915 [Hymenobacter gummosus]